MDKTLFRTLAAYVRGGARSVGVDPKAVSASNGIVAIEGTGMRVTWAPDAAGDGRVGWVVTETYHAMNLMAGTERFETRKVLAVAEEDVYGAARAALLAAAERSLDAALGDVANGA